MIPRFFASLTVLVLLGVYTDEATPHGAMISPRPRNIHAFQNGLLGSYYEATALNNNIYQTDFRSNSVCGQVQNGGPSGMDYDQYSSGIQASYRSGQVITVNVEITVYHFGHFEFSICPAGSSGTPTQDCFGKNKLTIVRDTMHSAPLDPNYPERAMLPPERFGKNYAYQVALPNNLPNGNYVLKWMYVSGNSCVASGYDRYPFPSSWGPMYTNGLAVCGAYDKATPLGAPEIFINCAEVAITGGSGSGPVVTPSRAPTLRSPTRKPVRTPTNTKNPVPVKNDGPALRTPSSVSTPTGSGATCCRSNRTGLIAANNCKGYVHCVNGVDRGYISCGSGLKFQRAGGFCDYANQVQCSSSCSRAA